MKYYAELINSCGCSIDIVSSDSIEQLRAMIKNTFLPTLEVGDKIVISEE